MRATDDAAPRKVLKGFKVEGVFLSTVNRIGAEPSHEVPERLGIVKVQSRAITESGHANPIQGPANEYAVEIAEVCRYEHNCAFSGQCPQMLNLSNDFDTVLHVAAAREVFGEPTEAHGAEHGLEQPCQKGAGQAIRADFKTTCNLASKAIDDSVDQFLVVF